MERFLGEPYSKIVFERTRLKLILGLSVSGCDIGTVCRGEIIMCITFY